MKISARVDNSESQHHITLTTNDTSHAIVIAPKTTGFGSSANGGEVLFLALATCYCNDIYREAAKCSLQVERVEVEVNGDFGAEGEPAKNVTYRARVHARGTEADIHALMQHTDQVVEIQNSLRVEIPVKLGQVDAETM